MKYQGTIESLQKELETFKGKCQHDIVSNPSGHFSSSQIQYFLTSKPVKFWHEDDIMKALTLRTLSPMANQFINEQWKYPMPSSATISWWISKYDVDPGILNSVIDLLQHQASTELCFSMAGCVFFLLMKLQFLRIGLMTL